jgi:hypothetical protein
MITQIPSGLPEIIKVFGDPNDPKFEATHIVQFDLPYTLFYAGKPLTKTRGHKLVVDNFRQAFQNIEDAGLASQFKEYNGIYSRRPIRGQTKHLSTHSWGIAIDMGASTHPLGDKKATWPKPILDAFTKAGFYWGGNFKSRRDSMHFQAATNY